MATLTTYRVLVQNEVGDYSSRAQNIVDQGVKTVYQEILNYCDSLLIGTTEEDVTATTSQRFITPTNQYTEIHKVLYAPNGSTTFDELDPMTEADYYKYYVNSDDGNPTQFYTKGNKVYFDLAPIDAGTVKVVGVEVQDELEGSVTSVIPDRFTGVVVIGAAAYFKAYERIPDAKEYESRYKGPFADQGRIAGMLGEMKAKLALKKKVVKPKFFGRK